MHKSEHHEDIRRHVTAYLARLIRERDFTAVELMRMVRQARKDAAKGI